MSVEVVSATTAKPAAADPPRRRTAWLIEPVAGLVADPAVRQGAWSVADQAVASAASFLTGLIVARATSKPEFGVYYLAMTLVLLARGIQSQLIVAPYMIFCHRRHGRALAEYTGSSLVHQLVLSAAAMACVLGFAASIALGLGPRDLLPAIGALLLAMPLLLLREFGRNHALSNLKTIAALVLDGTAAAVQLGLLAALWSTGLLSVAGAYFVMAAAAAVACGQWLWMERGRWRVARARIRADWRHNWRLARWALASHLVGCTTPFIMPWILAAARGQADTGLLGACGTLAGVANLFVMGLSNFLAPSIARAYSRGGKAAMRRVVVRALAALGIIVGAICLLSLVAGEYLVVWVYGSQYAGGGPVLTVCLLSVLGISLSIVAGNGLWVLDRPHETFLPDVIATAAALGTAAALVPSHGAMGAALAMLSGTTSGALLKALRFVQLMRKLPGGPPPAPEHCERP
jgi:O-antigen/teichoic acid export membrane protein